MRITRSNPPNIAPPIGSYSHAVRVDTPEAVWIYVSGQIAHDADGNLVGSGDLPAQTEQVFRNLARVLEANRASFDDVVKIQTFLTTMDGLQGSRDVRARYLPDEPPARSGEAPPPADRGAGPAPEGSSSALPRGRTTRPGRSQGTHDGDRSAVAIPSRRCCSGPSPGPGHRRAPTRPRSSRPSAGSHRARASCRPAVATRSPRRTRDERRPADPHPVRPPPSAPTRILRPSSRRTDRRDGPGGPRVPLPARGRAGYLSCVG